MIEKYIMRLNEEAPFTTLHFDITLILLKYAKSSERANKASPYASKYMPAIPLAQYIERISIYTQLNDETLISALIYIDRLIVNKKMLVTAHDVHRLLLVACIVSMKFHYDNYYDNLYYSTVSGLPLKELNYLELEFLEDIGYHLTIKKKLYNRYKKAISLYKRK